MSEVLIRQYGNVAGLALLVYDCVLTWEREVQCVWIESPWFTKLSFFLSRYLAVATQIINIIFSSPSLLQWQNGDCLAWFTFQLVAVLALICNLEIVMMVRVYALYDRRRLVGLLLILWFTLSRVYNVWMARTCLAAMAHEANLFCIVKTTPNDSKWFSLLIVGNQALLWLLTYGKYRNRAAWSNHPLVRLVIRDNSWVFLVTTGMLTSLLPYTLYVQQLGHIIFCLLTCAFSIMSCRLILNMVTLKSIHGSLEQAALSTVLTMSEIESCVSSEVRTSSSS